MFESAREKILLGAVLVVLMVFFVDLLAAPLWRYANASQWRISELRTKIAHAERLLTMPGADAEKKDFQVQRIRPANEQGQNEFRRCLESEAGQEMVTDFTPKLTEDLSELENLKLISYNLGLLGPLESLHVFLENLDASSELLRIDNLKITNSSLEEPNLDMNMTVSTVAQQSQES